METIPEKLQDFKSFEKEIFDIMCGIARGIMREHLEMLDLSIMGLRDTEEYRNKDIRESTIKTLMGEVTYSRRYYKTTDGRYVFLLDELMGIDCGCGLYSDNLVEQTVIECTEKSYRKAAASISSLTGQNISAMGAWGVLQNFGEKLTQQENQLRELDACESTGYLGNISSRVIMQEMDDVWLSMQNEKRQKRLENPTDEAAVNETTETTQKKSKKAGKKPIHVGIAYTGWTQTKDGKHKTANKIAYASFDKTTKFVSDFEMLMRHRYDMDGVERRITNGDGDPWIKAAAEMSDSIFQLDPYHRSQAIIRAISEKSDRNDIYAAIKEKDVDNALDIISDLHKATQDEKEQKKIEELYNYFHSNKDNLLTWQERGITLPEPPTGVTYRNLGVQESNNCSLVTLRMKHRRCSWSVNGADHMAGILCYRHTIGLDTMLGVLPEAPPAKEIVQPLSAAKAPLHDGKGYGADWLRTEMPFEQAFKTNGREAIRGILRMKPPSGLYFV